MCPSPPPKAPEAPKEPPQLAKVPDAMAVRSDIISQNLAQGGGAVQSTLLTGGLGDPMTDNKLAKKTLLGA